MEKRALVNVLGDVYRLRIFLSTGPDSELRTADFRLQTSRRCFSLLRPIAKISKAAGFVVPYS